MFGFASKAKSRTKKKKPGAGNQTPAAAKAGQTEAQKNDAKPPAPPEDPPILESLDHIGAPPRQRVRGRRGASGERERVIEQALMVQKKQSRLLDDLDDGVKERLRTMAMKKFFDEKPDPKP